MIVVALTASWLMLGLGRADESKMDAKDLPGPVLAAVKARFPAAKVTAAAREEADGKTVYEVAIRDDEAAIDLAVSPKGKIREIEREVAPKRLPTAVTAAVEAKYPRGKIKKAEEVVKFKKGDEKKTYEVVVAIPGRDEVEVKLSRKGKILADDDDEDDETDDKKSEKKSGKKSKDADDNDD